MEFLCEFPMFGVNLAVDVAATKYGNHLIQCLFKKQIPRHHAAMMRKWIYPFSLRLSGDVFGCRVIQRIINSSAVHRGHKVDLVKSLREQIARNERGRRSLKDLLISMNGNHVIQAVLRMALPAESVDFIKEQLERDLGPFSLSFSLSI